ncbi:MAG: hypothetical protein ACKOAU_12210 [Pirellula sp.]
MNSIFKTYLVTGAVVCLLFGLASFTGWHLPVDSHPRSSGSSSSSRSSNSRSTFFPGGGSTSGRSFGGFWGGGK